MCVQTEANLSRNKSGARERKTKSRCGGGGGGESGGESSRRGKQRKKKEDKETNFVEQVNRCSLLLGPNFVQLVKMGLLLKLIHGRGGGRFPRRGPLEL